MNQIQIVQMKLEAALPGAKLTLDRPKHGTGVWFLDVEFRGRSISIQWRPKLGFGITAADSGRAYGEGPDETHPDTDATIRRSIQLLRGEAAQDIAVTADALTLAQVRERLLISQKDIANRLGMSQAAISQLEKDPARSQVDTLQKLVAAIGATLEIRIVFRDRGPIRLKTVEEGLAKNTRSAGRNS